MKNQKAIVTQGSFKGVTVWIEGTDVERLGTHWFHYRYPVSLVYADREEKDQLPESGMVYCGKHLDGPKQGLSDFFHETELEVIK